MSSEVPCVEFFLENSAVFFFVKIKASWLHFLMNSSTRQRVRQMNYFIINPTDFRSTVSSNSFSGFRLQDVLPYPVHHQIQLAEPAHQP